MHRGGEGDGRGEPPLERWAEEEAIRQVERIARTMETSSDFDRDVVPLLRRLTSQQLDVVEDRLAVNDPERPES
jgi:hypothetical protein